MDRARLKEILDEIRVPDSCYCLSAAGAHDDCWVLDQAENGYWEVYLWERGRKADLYIFEEEEGACAHLLNQFIGIGGIKMNGDRILPLGTIVKLQGGSRKMIIVARALQVQNGGQVLYFDYGAVPYPLGVVGDQMAYFQQDIIEGVYYLGYTDKEEKQAVENVKRFLADHPDIVRGSKENWK